jgi:hypothetical protein
MKKYDKQRLFEVLGKIDPTFKPSAQLLTEWNFDKKKGEGKEDEKEKDSKKDEKEEGSEKKKFNFEKKEDKESKEHEEAETPEEEEKEHEEKKELKETDAPVAKKVPVVNWDKAKVGK